MEFLKSPAVAQDLRKQNGLYSELQRLVYIRNGRIQKVALIRRLVAEYQSKEGGVHYNDGQQHDPVLFFQDLLACLQEELKIGARHLANIFEIEVENTIQCLGCRRVKIVPIVLPNILLLETSKKTLHEALQEYQTSEMYEQECPMPHCKSKKAETTKKILKYPSCLNVVLKRFSFNKRKNTAVKICKMVKTPIVLQCKGGDLSYILGAGLNHEGHHASSGHCIVNWRDSESGLFTRFAPTHDPFFLILL